MGEVVLTEGASALLEVVNNQVNVVVHRSMLPQAHQDSMDHLYGNTTHTGERWTLDVPRQEQEKEKWPAANLDLFAQEQLFRAGTHTGEKAMNFRARVQTISLLHCLLSPDGESKRFATFRQGTRPA
jgi:hypothetical protein